MNTIERSVWRWETEKWGHEMKNTQESRMGERWISENYNWYICCVDWMKEKWKCLKWYTKKYGIFGKAEGKNDTFWNFQEGKMGANRKITCEHGDFPPAKNKGTRGRRRGFTSFSTTFHLKISRNYDISSGKFKNQNNEYKKSMTRNKEKTYNSQVSLWLRHSVFRV